MGRDAFLLVVDVDEGANRLLWEVFVRTLAERDKFPLRIWPYHAMLGGIGHALAPIVEEAVFFHSIARRSPPRFEVKGRHPLTEHYSALHPEVRSDENGGTLASANRDLVETLFGFDALIVAGQAKSHCLAWTVDDLLGEALARDASLVKRIHLLEDCRSSAPGGPDFTREAGEAFRRFEQAGMQIVKSTDTLPAWTSE